MNALELDDKGVKQVARMYLKNDYGRAYVACEKYDFLWYEDEILDFERMWKEGKTLIEIAEYFNRPQIEILFLAADRAEEGAIKERKGGLLGEFTSTETRDIEAS